MLKPQIEKKAKIVEDIRERVGQAQIGILADFTGLKVESMTLLRRQVKEAGGELKVAKNTLLKRAAGDGNLIEPISQDLVGPNALVLGYEDPVALAKILIKFAQDKPLLKIKGGVMPGRPLTAQEVDALSKLPAREVLLAQLLGLLQAPPQALVNLLSGVAKVRPQKSMASCCFSAAPSAFSLMPYPGLDDVSCGALPAGNSAEHRQYHTPLREYRQCAAPDTTAGVRTG